MGPDLPHSTVINMDNWPVGCHNKYFDGLVHNRCKSGGSILESRFFCINPLIYSDCNIT